MIDDDGKADQHLEGGRYGEALLFDIGKFLTTLSLFTLGGVLTVADTARKGDIPLLSTIVIVVVLSLGAMLAAATSATIAVARYTGKPIKARLDRYILGTVALLGYGLGMFFFMWIDKLD